MTDFDLTWQKPTDPQLEALSFVHRALHGRPLPDMRLPHHLLVKTAASFKAAATDAGQSYSLTEYDWAEFVLLADSSLWYTQAKRWQDGDTSGLTGDTDALALGGRAISAVVDWGYQNSKWWDIESIWPSMGERVSALAHILDLGRITQNLRQHSMLIVSSGFQMLPRLLLPKLNLREAYKALETEGGLLALFAALQAHCDPAAEKRLRQALKANTRPCINPFCTQGPDGVPKLVNLTRKSGACCRACMSFECTHPTCTKRAATHSWKRYTHPWGTKIADAHLPFRKDPP